LILCFRATPNAKRRAAHDAARERARMFPSSARATDTLDARADDETEDARTTRADDARDADETVEDAAESARARFRLQGKAGYDRVLDALKRERESVKETRQYLFGRLLNLQLEEAVLRDHLNATVNAADDGGTGTGTGTKRGRRGREMETRETQAGAET
jgi:hypothetical protein